MAYFINILVAYEDDYIREKCAGILSRLDLVSSVLQLKNSRNIEQAVSKYNPQLMVIDSSFILDQKCSDKITTITGQYPGMKAVVLLDDAFESSRGLINEKSGLDTVAMQDIVSYVHDLDASAFIKN